MLWAGGGLLGDLALVGDQAVELTWGGVRITKVRRVHGKVNSIDCATGDHARQVTLTVDRSLRTTLAQAILGAGNVYAPMYAGVAASTVAASAGFRPLHVLAWSGAWSEGDKSEIEADLAALVAAGIDVAGICMGNEVDQYDPVAAEYLADLSWLMGAMPAGLSSVPVYAPCVASAASVPSDNHTRQAAFLSATLAGCVAAGSSGVSVNSYAPDLTSWLALLDLVTAAGLPAIATEYGRSVYHLASEEAQAYRAVGDAIIGAGHGLTLACYRQCPMDHQFAPDDPTNQHNWTGMHPGGHNLAHCVRLAAMAPSRWIAQVWAYMRALWTAGGYADTGTLIDSDEQGVLVVFSGIGRTLYAVAQLSDIKPASSYTCPDTAGHTYIIHSLGALSTSTGVAGRDIDVTVSTIPQLVEVMT